MQIFRPQEILFKEFSKLKEIGPILKLMKQDECSRRSESDQKSGSRPQQCVGTEFLFYILRHILARKVGEGIKLKIKNDYSLNNLKKQFLDLGFKIEPLVYEPGQISFRGDIIEFWDIISLYPIRLEFFDTKLEDLYFYDLKTKKRIENISKIFIYPPYSHFEAAAKIWFVSKQESHGLRSFIPFRMTKNKDGMTEDGRSKIAVFSQKDSTYWASDDSVLDRVVLNLPIKNHFKANLLQIGKLSKQKNQIIFIFSKYETAIRELVKDHKSKIFILPPINFKGFSYKNIHLFTDADFEKKIPRRRFAKIVQFGVGDFVVHIDYGICKLEGIGPKSLPLSLDEQIISAIERKDFYYHLRFRDNAFLYSHLSEKNRITKYIGDNPKLSSLGSREWKEIKILATLEAKRLAKKLSQLFLDLQKQKINFNYTQIKNVLNRLEKTFPFNLTSSQKKAIFKVNELLKKEKPIDHLIVGESSSGKTEVALRIAAMFLVNQKQVLMLAPTTFLSYQNFLVAKSRLKHIGVRVGVLSRFNSDKENQKNIQLYNQNKIRMIVGTHKILFSKLTLKNTGLIIIDEEQRFGVEQKEKLRFKKQDLSILNLSATPIPRTLNLALTGVKTMSILNEIPTGRGEIKNAVLSQDDFGPIKSFIRAELNRRGQVYFVAPLIKDLHIIEQELKKIGIKQKIVLAYGRMNEKKLATIFSDFALGKIKILLSTAIVEHGLDFPRANTMILWFGERLGMADLYQLRGRVGRSGQSANFIIVVPKKISDNSYSRLIDFLSLTKEQNSFYKLSIYDLEKRGQGDIFGKRQHGVINKVGLYLFSELVKKELG